MGGVIGQTGRRRVLLVDGDAEFSERLREAVELCSHEIKLSCEAVSSAKEALARLSEQPPDVIIIDAHIEDGDAFELVRATKNPNTTVVITSTHPSASIESAARRYDAEYSQKSEDPEDLESFIRKIAFLAEHQPVNPFDRID